MLLKNVFLKNLRDNRNSLLWWGGGLGLLMLAIPSGYDSLFTGTDRAAAIKQVEQLTNSFSFLLGKAYDLQVLGGYIDYRMPIFAVILCIYTLLAGSVLVRGEEERGSLDLVLATPHSRTSVLLQKWAAMALTITIIGLLIWLGLLIGVTATKYSLGVGALFLSCLGLILVALVYGSLALLLSQFASRKVAASWTGGLLASTFLMDGLGESISGLSWLKYFSPFYYFNLNKPLSPSVGASWLGLLVLALIAVPLVGVALLLYLQRDVNGYFHIFGQSKVVSMVNQPVKEPKSLWRANPFSFGVRTNLTSMIIWSVGIATYVVLIMSVYNSIRDSLKSLLSSSSLYASLGFGGIATDATIVSAAIFIILVLLYPAFAVTQLLSWTSDETDRRTELLLSTPQPRWRLLLTRFLANIANAAIAVLFISLVLWLLLNLANVQLDSGRTIGALFGLWVLAVIVNAAGFLLAAFWPGNAVGILGGLVIISYLTDTLAQLLKLPDWVVSLSVFHQYGRPLLNGVNWTATWAMLGLSLLFVAVAIFRFNQRDIVK